MKYFTPDWCRGESPDQDDDLAFARYSAYLAAVEPAMSPAIRHAALKTNLHDGFLLHVAPRASALVLEVRVGDLGTGYSSLRLTYKDASISEVDEAFLRGAVDASDVSILYDEWEHIEPSAWGHRILFWANRSYREIAVRCEAFELTQTGSTTDRFPDRSG